MINLIIPALAISGSIVVGSPFNGDNYSHQLEATRILDSGYVYRYSDYPAYGAHDTGLFKRLPDIRLNALVILDNKRYRVQSKEIIQSNDVTKLLNDKMYLFTCRNGYRNRLIVLLK